MASRFDLSKFASETERATRTTERAGREVSDFASEVRRATESVREIAEAGGRAGSAGDSAAATTGAKGSGTTTAAAGADLARIGTIAAGIGPRLQAGFASALAPLRTDTATMESQFNRLGGTLTEQARRIDSAMKMPQFKAATAAASQGLMGLAADLGSVQEAAGRMSPAIAAAFFAFKAGTTLLAGTITGVSALVRTMSFLGAVGDVARKPLDRIRSVVFAPATASANALRGAVGSVGRTANTAGTSVKAFGRDLLVALGAFGLAYKAVAFFSTGIKGAVDLNETINATKVTFEAATGPVFALADGFAQKFGIVKDETLNAANAFGDFKRATGGNVQEAAAFSVTMTQLAADLSSFKHVPFEEAVGKISSGLRGQSEPLSAFGVLLDETTVKAKAAAMGIGDGSKELSQSAKVGARAALIQQGLIRASGDLARTQGDAANQFRKAGGGVVNFGVAIGTVLMPAVTAAVLVWNDFGAAILGAFETGKGSLSGWVDYAVGAIESVGVVVRNLGEFWQVAKLRAREFGANFIAVLKTLPANVVTVAAYIGRNWYQLITDGINAAAAAFHNFGTYIGELAHSVWQWLQDPMSEFQAPDWKPLLDGFKATAEQFPELAKPAWVSMQKDIDGIYGKIAQREAARKKEMAQGARPAAQADAEALDKTKHKEDKYAGAHERGSKEAYNVLVKGQGQKDKDSVAKEGNKISAQALQVQKDIRQALQARPAAAAPAFNF